MGREGGTEPALVQGVPSPALPSSVWGLCKLPHIWEPVGTAWRQLPWPSWAAGCSAPASGCLTSAIEVGRTFMLGVSSASLSRVVCGDQPVMGGSQ